MINTICFDLGDTLVSEETVIHDSSGRTITANAIDGVFEVLSKLKKSKYKLALIANDEDATGTRNIISKSGLIEYFDTIVISGEIGIEKPDTKIFEVILNNLGVTAKDAVMVGNRVDTDIVGANRIGMTSVLFKWNDRYPDPMNSDEEKPDFTIFILSELLKVLPFLERLE